jgi:hypothetical protein
MTAALTAAPASADHTSFPTRVTLMGSLQSELGCDADWDETCTATDLKSVPRSRSFDLVALVPAGTYQFKVRLNGSWTESYGLDGTADDAPLVLPTATRLRFLYDGESHRLTVTPAAAPSANDPADRSLAQESLREDLTRERFYFVMADRFENGDPATTSAATRRAGAERLRPDRPRLVPRR